MAQGLRYTYDDGHTFSGAPYRTTTDTSRAHSPGIDEQGGVTIRVQAIDNAGNEGPWSDPVHYVYDATAPIGGKLTMKTKLFPAGITATLENNVYTITPALSLDGADVFSSVSVVVTDDNMDTSDVPVYIDGNTGANGYMKYNPSAQVWNYTGQTTIPDFSKAGPHSLVATFKDLAGNTKTLTAIFTTDNIAPAGGSLTMKTKLFPSGLTVTSPTDGVYTLQDLSMDGVDQFKSLSIAVTDTNLDTTAKPIVSVDGIDNGYMEYNNSTHVWGYAGQTSVPTFAPGTHNLVATFSDLAGNNTTLTARFTTDNVAPVGGSLTMKTNLHPDGITVSSPDANGVYIITPALSITGVDVFNSLNVAVSDFNLDTNDVPVYVDGIVNGDMVYDSTNQVWNYANQSGVIVFASGEHDLVATFKDKAGNIKTLTAQFTTDNTSPVVSVNSYGQNGNVIKPNVTASDLVSGSNLTYKWTTSVPSSDVVISNDTILEPTFIVKNDGTYVFTLITTDEAGNKKSTDFTFTYTTPAPSVTVIPFSNVTATGNDTNNTGTSNNLTDNDQGVLGAQTTKDSTNNTMTPAKTTTSILGDSTNKNNDNIWGLAWYWWLVILAAAAAIIWWIVAAMRSRDNQNA